MLLPFHVPERSTHLQETTEKPVEKSYPRLFTSDAASLYLREYRGIERSASALAKDRCAGDTGGPSCVYLDAKPYYRREILDAWVEARISETRPASLAKKHEYLGRPNQRRAEA
jgi:hypothetical protein